MGITRDNDAVAALPLAGESALWDAAKSGNQAARERLIETYLPHTRILAARLYAGRIGNDLEFAEYLQFATVGLIEAIDRYDPGKEALFKTFAGHRINGAMLSGLKHLSEKREQISAHKSERADRLDSGKAVLDEPEKDLFQQLAEVAIGLALGYLLDDRDDHGDDAVFVPESHYVGLELRQMQQKVRSLINSLPHQERMVIKYHYLNHVSFADIAENLGLSKGRISQIHRHALDLLRNTIKSVKSCDVAW